MIYGMITMLQNIKNILYKNVPILIILIIYFILLGFINPSTRCIFKMFTGIPCPSCGMTRSYGALLHGDFTGAFFYHPLFLIPILIFVFYILKDFSPFVSRVYNNTYFWIVIGVIFVIVYAIRMYLLFPNKQPMNTYEGSFLLQFIKLIQSLLD